MWQRGEASAASSARSIKGEQCCANERHAEQRDGEQKNIGEQRREQRAVPTNAVGGAKTSSPGRCMVSGITSIAALRGIHERWRKSSRRVNGFDGRAAGGSGNGVSPSKKAKVRS